MKHILITGGNKGLGEHISLALLNEGYSVYCLSRSETQSEALTSNSNYFWFSYDLGQSDKIEQFIKKHPILNKVAFDGLVNNSAIAYDDIVSNLKYTPILEMFNVNVFSAMALTRYIIRKGLLKKKQVSIVHISSVSVHTAYKGLSMYASSKGAIEAFSKGVAREWGEMGVRSNCVVPGFMETGMSESLSSSQKDRIYKRTSLKKATSLESVADTVAFLLSDKAKSITGQSIMVDNGTI